MAVFSAKAKTAGCTISCHLFGPGEVRLGESHMIKQFVAAVALASLAVPHTAIAQRYGPAFQGSKLELTEAEADRILQSIARDYQAGADFKIKCDFNSYDKMVDRIANQERQAAASRAEVEKLSLTMAAQLQEIMSELAKFVSLDGNPALSTLQDQVKSWAVGAVEFTKAVPVVGNAVTLVDKLRETGEKLDNNEEAQRILKTSRQQMNELRAAYLTIIRLGDIQDYARESNLALNKLRVNCDGAGAVKEEKSEDGAS